MHCKSSNHYLPPKPHSIVSVLGSHCTNQTTSQTPHTPCSAQIASDHTVSSGFGLVDGRKHHGPDMQIKAALSFQKIYQIRTPTPCHNPDRGNKDKRLEDTRTRGSLAGEEKKEKARNMLHRTVRALFCSREGEHGNRSLDCMVRPVAYRNHGNAHKSRCRMPADERHGFATMLTLQIVCCNALSNADSKCEQEELLVMNNA